MPITEAIKSLIDLSDLDVVSLGSPYPFTVISRDAELGLFSCMVCIATYLEIVRHGFAIGDGLVNVDLQESAAREQ